MSAAYSAAFWGFFSGAALVVGAAVGYFVKVPSRVVAGIMAFGSGVLISALSFELMEEAFNEAGLAATATGFLLGAIIYAAANRLLVIYGAKHRKRSGGQQPSEEEDSGSGAAIAVGALLDGVPESLPALLKAFRMTEKAAAVGFDWRKPVDVMEKMREEMAKV